MWLVLPLAGCTLIKPVTGAIAGPAILLGQPNAVGWGCCCGDGDELLGVLLAGAAVGTVCGLVNGVISDFRWLFDETEDPTRNWADPFRTNH